MISRRHFLQVSASAALMPLLTRVDMAATLWTRLSWPAFRNSASYEPYLRAVRSMRANKDTTQPSSWGYWVGVHKSYCPHGKPYFLAWHRGFLYRFEAQLRRVSGYAGLVLPYWNYYSDPVMPAEFTDPTSPLYRSDRVNTDVRKALGLTAFDDAIINFQRGKTDAFEPAVESVPHNPVHNLIGGAMANVSISPRDPIFWLHHASVDRLWDAWVHAGDGRHMPSLTSSYWSGSFSYGAMLHTMARSKTYSPQGLGYRYDDRTLPSALPSGYSQSVSAGTQALLGEPLPAQGVSVGGVAGIALGPQSASLRLPLSPADQARVRSLLDRPAQPSDAEHGPLRVVLDGVRLSALGARGGFAFQVMLNLPRQGLMQSQRTYLLGTLGPFEISTAQHMQMMQVGMHGPVRLVFPATETLRRIWPQPLDALTIDFVRVDGSGTPMGRELIGIDQVRVEADQ